MAVVDARHDDALHLLAAADAHAARHRIGFGIPEQRLHDDDKLIQATRPQIERAHEPRWPPYGRTCRPIGSPLSSSNCARPGCPRRYST